MNSGNLNERIKMDRKVIVRQYAPQTFKKIRNMCSVDELEMMQSLKASENVK